MNVENMKQIIELLTSLGIQGKEAFITYLIFTHGLNTLLGAACIALVGFVAHRLIRQFSNESKLQHIRDTLGVGCRGAYTDHEHADVITRITKLMGYAK